MGEICRKRGGTDTWRLWIRVYFCVRFRLSAKIFRFLFGMGSCRGEVLSEPGLVTWQPYPFPFFGFRIFHFTKVIIKLLTKLWLFSTPSCGDIIFTKKKKKVAVILYVQQCYWRFEVYLFSFLFMESLFILF